MTHYIAQSFRSKAISKPIQNGDIRYYSVMNDRSSSIKTLDEKELFLMKTAQYGIPKFSIISLEEPNHTNAAGLKTSMEESFRKLKLSINWSDHEIGICSDGASVNMALYRSLKSEFCDYYIQSWYPGHRLELAISDSFKDSNLNEACKKNCLDIYYFFKRATLQWQLFKLQGGVEGLGKKNYKRQTGVH